MQQDLRIIKTKEKLFHALGELMKKTPFDQITVSDLVKESGITRKTFYNHYQDKADLIHEYQGELLEYIETNFMLSDKTNDETIVHLARYLNKQDYLLTALLSQNGSLEVQNSIRNAMELYCKKILNESITEPLQLEYQSILTAGALFSVIQHWLVSGKKISPKKLANTISSFTLS